MSARQEHSGGPGGQRGDLGSRVAVIGGSIAGCSAAIALGHLGCEVHVFERSSSALRDRGSGIAIPIALRDTLIAGGYLPPDYPSIVPAARRWTPPWSTMIPADFEAWTAATLGGDDLYLYGDTVED